VRATCKRWTAFTNEAEPHVLATLDVGCPERRSNEISVHEGRTQAAAVKGLRVAPIPPCLGQLACKTVAKKLAGRKGILTLEWFYPLQPINWPLPLPTATSPWS
jgi:hypothetical protein